MGHKFHSAVQRRQDITLVRIGGVIDEDNRLAQLGEQIDGGTTVVDLGGIERINSCGVRDWVNWLASIEESSSVVLVGCSPAIVAQINLVNNFTGTGVVKSFYVPYFCPECDEEKVLLVEAVEIGPPPYEPPQCRCDECGQIMDFDDMPDSYFAFLAQHRAKIASQDRGLDDAISAFSSDDADKKIRPRAAGTSSFPGNSNTYSAAGSTSSPSSPGVPSLPSLSESSRSVPMHRGMMQSEQGQPTPQTPLVDPRSSRIVIVLIGILIAAIAVLITLLLAT